MSQDSTPNSPHTPNNPRIPTEALLDAAIAAYPRAPLPPGFTARVMAELRSGQAAPAGRARPPLGLGWADLALPALGLLVAGSCLAALLWLDQADPTALPRATGWLATAWSVWLPGVPPPSFGGLAPLAWAAGLITLALALAGERARRGAG
jgi:hypothetical protein